MRYLIIDDNENMRRIIRQTVCSKGDFAAECSDGNEAVEFYGRFQPDYVLMDIAMQKTDGLKATRNILKQYPAARIIIVTEYDTPAFRNAAEKEGAAAFFSKEYLSEIKDYIKSKSDEFLSNNIK